MKNSINMICLIGRDLGKKQEAIPKAAVFFHFFLLPSSQTQYTRSRSHRDRTADTSQNMHLKWFKKPLSILCPPSNHFVDREAVVYCDCEI